MSDDDGLEGVSGADSGLRAAAATVSQLRGRGLRSRTLSSAGVLGGEERLRREGHQGGLEHDPRRTHGR